MSSGKRYKYKNSKYNHNEHRHNEHIHNNSNTNNPDDWYDDSYPEYVPVNDSQLPRSSKVNPYEVTSFNMKENPDIYEVTQILSIPDPEEEYWFEYVSQEDIKVYDLGILRYTQRGNTTGYFDVRNTYWGSSVEDVLFNIINEIRMQSTRNDFQKYSNTEILGYRNLALQDAVSNNQYFKEIRESYEFRVKEYETYKRQEEKENNINKSKSKNKRNVMGNISSKVKGGNYKNKNNNQSQVSKWVDSGLSEIIHLIVVIASIYLVASIFW